MKTQNRTRLTDRGERIVKRWNGPDAIPFGAVIIERGGRRLVRTEHGWHELFADGTEGGLVDTLDLRFPVRQVRPAVKPGAYLDRHGRRQVERTAAKATARLRLARIRQHEVERVAEFLRSKGVGVPTDEQVVEAAEQAVEASR
jgi:hypothetical protein